ncbi:MAG: DUF3299 domain-containing protein [Candidatus Hydrogenedentota bacterium]
MRKRAVRDLGLIAGIGVILTGLVFANSELRRGGLVEQMESWRRSVEAAREEQGLELISWDVVRETRGTRQTEATFPEELKQQDGTRVDVIGFMVPVYEFREVSDFLLLPLSIECYFCEEPPLREVIHVEMREGETANLVNEPILINGRFSLDSEAESGYFYTIEDALWGPGEPEGDVTRREISIEHRLHEPVEEMREQLREAPERENAPQE